MWPLDPRGCQPVAGGSHRALTRTRGRSSSQNRECDMSSVRCQPPSPPRRLPVFEPGAALVVVLPGEGKAIRGPWAAADADDLKGPEELTSQPSQHPCPLPGVTLDSQSLSPSWWPRAGRGRSLGLGRGDFVKYNKCAHTSSCSADPDSLSCRSSAWPWAHSLGAQHLAVVRRETLGTAC